MISNYLLNHKINSLKKERERLTLKQMEISIALREFNISKQAAWKSNRGKINKIDPDLLARRNATSQEIEKTKSELIKINGELRECYKEKESEKNAKLLEVFKEIFTQDQIIEIRQEAERRMRGEHPFLLSFSIKEGIDDKQRASKYKKLAKEHLEKMIEFRLLLTGLIEKGCEQFGEGDFLKFISPLNRLIIPVEELRAIKNKNLL